MGTWLTPELNTVLISTVLAIIGAATPFVVAWFRYQTKKINEMAQINHALLEKNTEIAKKIEKQTDGINAKMMAIAEVVAFTKGQIKGRKEGEGLEPYEDLERLEDLYSKVSDINFDQEVDQLKSRKR